MFRLKTIFGDKLSARLFENQTAQALIRCLALNKMTLFFFQVCSQAIQVACEMGITVSCDLNYRAKLWKWGKSTGEVMTDLVNMCDVALGNEEDAERVFGIKAPEANVTAGKVEADTYRFVCEELAKKFPSLKTISITLRGSLSASHNTWSGVLWTRPPETASGRYEPDRRESGKFFCAPSMYDELWTGAKAMYKLEPAIAIGGEVVIYAPHLDVVSHVHGKYIYEVGYHILPYFLNDWERFKDIPLGVLAHSTHLRGSGAMANGTEKPNVKVTLASKISEEDCARLNLGYLDPAKINLDEWKDKEDEGILFVPKAGEILYRLKT